MTEDTAAARIERRRGVPHLAAHLARVDRALDGYRRRVTPEPEELKRLRALVAARPLVFEAWAFAMGRTPLAEAARSIPRIRERAAAIAARARVAFS